jgi:hypothetical protein
MEAVVSFLIEEPWIVLGTCLFLFIGRIGLRVQFALSL